MKNIIFVIVDALRADRLEFGGYKRELAPNINELAKSGLNFTECYSAGCPTSIAFPSIWTSTLPLDYGGYTNGIHSRPKMLSEELQSYGYQTYGITTGHPSTSQYGYDRGFDTFVDLIDMYQWFRSKYISNFKDDIDAWVSNEMSDNDTCKKINTTYGSMLDDSIKLINGISQHSRRTKGVDKLHKALVDEKNILEKNTMNIVCKLGQLESNFSIAIGRPIVTKWIKTKFAYKRILRYCFNRWIPIVSKRKLNSGRVVNNTMKNFLKRRDKKKPFFMYLHYFDLHEYRYLIPQISFRRLIHLPRDILKVYKAREAKVGGFLYDLALVNMDRHILELKSNINKSFGNESPIIVLTSDHGVNAGLPFRPRGSSFDNLFFDNFTHVPFIINGVDIEPKECHKLISHLDLAPSILNMVGAPIPSEMQGMSVINHEEIERSYVISESGGSGQCNISKKTFYISVRSKKLRCTYIVNNFLPIEREVYCLDEDPDESMNLIDTDGFIEERNRLKRVTIKRVEKLRLSLPRVC